MCKLIIRIPGLGLFITSLPARLREHLLNGMAESNHSTSILQALPGKLDIKRHSLTLYTLCTGP